MEAPIQELEKEFDQIDFDRIMSKNQKENITGKDEYMELTTDVSKADPEFNISEVDDSIEHGAPDIRQNQENVDVQFHDSDLDRNFPFNDDQQMMSDKKIESLEMQTQVEIHNVNSKSKHDLDTTSSQPLDLVSSQSHRNGEVATPADEDLTDKKPLNLQTYTSLNEQVLNVIVED